MTTTSNNTPANSVRGEVSVEFEGRTIRLVPSFANIAAAEAVTEKTILELASELQTGKFFIGDMGRIFASVSEPKLDMDDVSRFFDSEGCLAMVKAVGGFIASAISAGQISGTNGKKPQARARKK
jgi:Phage tail tube protein, GTA-gp10